MRTSEVLAWHAVLRLPQAASRVSYEDRDGVPAASIQIGLVQYQWELKLRSDAEQKQC